MSPRPRAWHPADARAALAPAAAVRARSDGEYALSLPLSDPGLHFCVTRATERRGDKAQVTASCDDTPLHLVTHVETTAATEPDVKTRAAIPAGRAAKALLPAQHRVEAGCPCGQTLGTARRADQVDVRGPVTGSGTGKHRTARATSDAPLR